MNAIARFSHPAPRPSRCSADARAAATAAPGVQHRRDADFPAVVFPPEGLQGFTGRLKKQGIQRPPVAREQRIQCMVGGENDMKIADGQQHNLLAMHPFRFFEFTALRAMPVAAAVVFEFKGPALITAIKMSAQLRRAAGAS